MDKLNIICVDDEREVLNAVLKDLSPLDVYFQVEGCESADEALALMDELDAAGEYVALLISDHVMPGKTGVELLTEVSQDVRFAQTKKVLLTGQATHQDTIAAINQARIESYFEKPWQAEALLARARSLVTEYLFDKGLDYEPWLDALDNSVIYRRLT
ncbi:response regulator [Photobacterium sp. GSS17]|uniref:response regulator n=1 Tax=Photobacterium sp. GSS17 TaxID=3020715 RepID=UPI0023618911|nr:response regulator [Photobacterium sp. GSS17]